MTIPTHEQTEICKIINVGNYKGGVGKTKNAIMLALKTAQLLNKRVLFIDKDPQANATNILLRTKKLYSNEIFSFDKTLMTAIKEGSLEGIATEIIPNLELIPSYIDFANYPSFLDLKYGLVEEEDPRYHELTNNKINHFSKLLEPLKEHYDYIFIDVPPTKSYITDSAVMASDYILIVLATQELALEGAQQYLEDLQNLSNTYNGNFEICGVLPVLMDNKATLDEFILERASEIFGEENIFDNKVPNMARLKRFDNTGITDFDRHDKKVHELYEKVTKELIQRINYFEGE